MKRIALSILLLGSLLVGAIPESNAAVIPGAKCLKAGTKQIWKTKVYTCIKLGKKLYWDNGQPVRALPSPGTTTNALPSPTPSQSTSPIPTTSSSPSQSAVAPLLRTTDVSFRSGKLTVTWSGMGVDQKLLTSIRRINLWVLDSQVNSLTTPIWRVAGFIAPNPSSSLEVLLPPRQHLVRITATYLNGGETNSSATIRVIPNPLKISKPTDVVAEWENTDFKIRFIHDSSEEYLAYYQIRLTAGGSSKILDIKPSGESSTQSFVLTLQGNRSLFGPPQTVISGSVRTVNIFGNEGEEVGFPAPLYKTSLPSP